MMTGQQENEGCVPTPPTAGWGPAGCDPGGAHTLGGMDGFASVIAGALSPVEAFDPTNIEHILRAA